VAEARGRYEAGARPGGRPGDRRIGVVWHTQGSGKSLTMAFYAGRIIHEPAMENPTIVVLTDRNDLDDQLFGTFSRCQDLLRQPPVQAASRAHLRELLSVAAGGVVFTTIHKFFPEEKGDRHPVLSERRNIVVIADEAHRSQYDFIDGFARHMRDALPHASFIGFTGTPVEKTDANTRAVFGDYISVYDIQRAVEDGATVPIYYESRLAKLALDEAERPKIDPDFEEATEGEEVERKVVLVRDMWLTGFDAPSLHTMYLDKPMRGHGLMQAIARVNRVFRDKPGGLVVDYLGLAHELKAALATYTESGGRGRTALDQDEAVAVMREKYEVCCDLFHGFDRTPWTAGTPEERLALLPAAQEHILAQENGKDRYVRAVRELSQAFALAVPHEEALRIRDDVSFFQAVQAVLAKRAPGEARPEEELDHAVRQIISRAVAPEGVLDIFAAAGLQKPDISILSDQFLSEVRGMPQKNLAVELLQKLLNGEIRTRRRKNVVQARSFAEMLERTIRRYQNRAIEAAQVIEELIQLARDMREANARGEALGLSEEELAFYDALETNDSAVKVLGDETLRKIARELVHTVRNNVTIDWTLRENVRAHLRVLVKRILRKYGYPPDKQEKATQTVLEQAEVMSERWAA
jgi:type I site-specific restriction-modification system R (restriction) subunit